VRSQTICREDARNQRLHQHNLLRRQSERYAEVCEDLGTSAEADIVWFLKASTVCRNVFVTTRPRFSLYTMPAATESVRRGNTNELSPEDLEWTPSIRDEAAIAATLPSFMNDCRAQLTDTVPWTEEVWRLLLPRGRQFATRWRTRQPHEQISSAGQRRSTDRYLVNLKKHLLDQVFDRLSGCILEHLRSEDDESDPIKRAAVRYYPDL